MPDKQTIDLLLQEFRAFRDNEFREFKDDVATWKQDSGARLAIVENDVKSGIKGNGQPSRLAVVEKKVEDLEQLRIDERLPEVEETVEEHEKQRWYERGIAAAAGVAVTVAFKFAPLLFKKLFGAS